MDIKIETTVETKLGTLDWKKSHEAHITLKNAMFQLPRVADKWAALTGRDRAAIGSEITDLLRQHASAPMFGLAGIEMINVVDVNLALKLQYGANRIRLR